MNKRALYCTVICLYLSFSGFAQVYEDFNLSEYVTPDIVRSQLDFSLRTAGSFTDNETSKNDLFRINGDLNTAQYKFKSTMILRSSEKCSRLLETGNINKHSVLLS